MSRYHTVAKGDTLGKIAKANGTTVSELMKLNNIKDPNRIEVGQRIALKQETVLGFQLLFLDLNRDPIKGIDYIIEFAGKIKKGITPDNGLSKKIFTDTPEDEIRILVKRVDGTLKEVGKAISGYGNKLVTLISPSVKIEAKTERHPDLKPGERPDPKEPVKPAFDPKAKQPPTTEKKTTGLDKKGSATEDGKPITKVTGDIPDLSFLGEYVGGEISEADIEAAAKEIKCDPGLIYAIARQESGRSSFIKLGNRMVPTILYERHQFAKYSNNKYTEKYHDISGPAYHRTKKVKIVAKDNKGKPAKPSWKLIDSVTGSDAVEDDVYAASGLPQYKRLAKAYQLDKAAALQACSWGKFQIMGFNYKTASFNTVFDFVKAMSTGEPAHIRAFLKFASSNKTLLKGLREKDFEKIAEGHNGKNWKSINPEYASNIEKYYNEYSRN